MNKNIRIASYILIVVIFWMLSAIFVEEEIIPEKEPSLFKVAVQQSESQEYQPKIRLKSTTRSEARVEVKAKTSGEVVSIGARQNFKWSHPMIYHVGKEVGWSKINSSNTNTFNEFKSQFYLLKKELLKGKNFKISKIVPSEEKRKKFNKNLFEELREKHKI